MKLVSHNRIFQAAVVAAGMFALCSSDALAWGHRKASYGSYGSSGSSGSYASSGSYGSSGSSASYSSYGSYGSSGSSASYGGSSGGGGGLFARWHARKAAKHSSGSYGSAGSSGGSYYAYSASSGSSGSYGSGSYGSSGSSGSYSAPAYYESAPADAVPTEPQPAPPEETSAAIRVSVPADATVFVNDRPTTSTGGERNYVSRGLAGGRTYAYELRVEFTRDGEKVVENKLVRLRAGEMIDLTFGAGEQMAAEEAAPTNLTVHVPAEAKVTLAGAATKQAGETRTYATSALAPGQEWDGYVVRVELERNGQTLVEEKSLTIVGGQSYELSFDLDKEATTVASLN